MKNKPLLLKKQGRFFIAKSLENTIPFVYNEDAKNADKVQWIANEKILVETTEKTADGGIISTIRLREHTDDITCYIRFQLIGAGGICFSQPFTCDDGNMARFIIEDTRTDAQKFFNKLAHILLSARIYVVFQELYRKMF